MSQSKPLRELYALRESLYLQLNDIAATALSATTDPNNVAICRMFQVKYEVVKRIYDQILKIHGEIVTKVAVSNDPKLEDEHAYLKKVDDVYFTIESAVRELFPPTLAKPTVQGDAPINTTNQISTTRLPKLNLHKFEGKLENWGSFIQVFNRSIHENSTLSNVEKFEYLLGCLSDEPFNLIRTIVLSDCNYPIAYQALIDKYDNKRNLATYHWNRLQSLPKLKEESSTGLSNLFYSFKENLAALRALKFTDSLENFILFNLLFEKLDSNTRRGFEANIRDLKGECPTFEKLSEFVESQCRVLAAEHSGSCRGVSKASSSISRQRPVSALVANTSDRNCPICNQNHIVYSCPLLKAKSPADRYKLIKEKKLCINCLRSHLVKDCTSQSTCRTCRKNHHTLLHFEKSLEGSTTSNDINSAKDNIAAPVVEKLPSVNALSSSLSYSQKTAVLSTALVDVHDSQGGVHTMRAILDSGSEASFITAKSAHKLNMRGRHGKIQIQGIGANSSIFSSGSITVKISPQGSCQPLISIDVHVIPQVASVIPSKTLHCHSWEHISNLNLADPDFHISRQVEVLLGADVYSQIVRPGLILAPNDQTPSALNTIFGWVLLGTVPSEGTNCTQIQSFHTTVVEPSFENEISHTMKQFWQVEEVPVISSNLAEELCEKVYIENYSRLPSGRFVVPLPFRGVQPTFPESKDVATRRFFALEHRLKRNPILQQMYIDFMRDYSDSGHMEIATPIDKLDSYYIPHHCVMRPDSSSTKLRVVFDASAKAGNNQSLNDTLLIGSKLQQDIVTILLKFRLHSVVLIADVKQMYRQIQIASEYWDYQRIIWRFSPNDPLSEFRLKTVTYGVSSAPFLALRTMLQLALDGQDKYPLASNALQHDIYVDDIITGCDSISEAFKLQSELIQLCESGGFPLRKWSSNHPSLLEVLPAEHCQSSFSFDSDPLFTLKVLGLQWSPGTDMFTYQLTPLDRPCTKRGILSELARVFDPIGYLTPVTFFVKHLLQQLWHSGTGWDDPPPEQLANQWSSYKSELEHISRISIHRHLISDLSSPCQIHGYSDASMAGYAAVVFLRYQQGDSYIVRLIIAKSKVAPSAIDKLTIPRLELCGAVLLSKLLHLVLNVYSGRLNIVNIFAWTDSSIVLGWIRSPPQRWKTFVGNRVAYIQQRVSPDNWYHVASADNPADCASRGLLPSQLVDHSLWWSGPAWLSLPQSQWPPSKIDSSDSPCEEERSVKLLIAQLDSSILDTLLDRFSSLRTICNVGAYLFRFTSNCRNPSNHNIGPIDKAEAHTFLLRLVKLVQDQAFHSEIVKLKSKQLCSKPLRKLNLFLDDAGIIRVGGRLRHSHLPFEQKFPALLPQTHRLTSLIIEDTHKRNLHPGLKTLHYLLLQNFWILSAHRAIRRCLSSCYNCFRVNPPTVQPPMGDLPPFRLQQLKAFQIVGVDFGGPFQITMNRVRGAKSLKAYLCLFVCLSTRAIHLEIVSNLSTDAFLACLRRFIARRGHCSEIHSDCGTNFIGAARQLSNYCEAAAVAEGIKWKFNPPSAPHFGGIWEAGIKSVKTHLSRVVGDQILTFEELHTVFVQVEALLNSRPLSPMSSDPNDLNALTPGHFLTLAPLTSFPEPNITDIKVNRLNRWQLVQQMHQHFWKRWSNEFLHTLQQRSKWTNPSNPVQLNALVLIKDELAPPLRWHLGRIIEVHPGPDNVIRVVTLKTTRGILKRPVVKLCPLPSQS